MQSIISASMEITPASAEPDGLVPGPLPGGDGPIDRYELAWKGASVPLGRDLLGKIRRGGLGELEIVLFALGVFRWSYRVWAFTATAGGWYLEIPRELCVRAHVYPLKFCCSDFLPLRSSAWGRARVY